jgi:hypothetical protein
VEHRDDDEDGDESVIHGGCECDFCHMGASRRKW